MYNLMGFGLVIAGVLLVGFFASWWVAGGVFLIVFGNNIDQASDELEINRLMDKGLREAEAHGVEIVSTGQHGDGERYAYLKDPDGYLVELDAAT